MVLFLKITDASGNIIQAQREEPEVNRKLVIVLVLLLNVLAFFYPILIPVVFMLPVYYLLYNAHQQSKRMIDELREKSQRQKNQAEATDLPDPMTLLGSLLQVIEQPEPAQEAMEVLVNFGCRLSLSNFHGRVIVNLEDPHTRPTYEVRPHPLVPDGEIFELPGLRGRQKDRIGRYRFWRTTESICFARADEQIPDLPEYMIPYDPNTLAPEALAKLDRTTGSAWVYVVVWGTARGKSVTIL